MEFWHSHAIISDEARTGLLTCNFSDVGPLQAVPDWQNAPEVSSHVADAVTLLGNLSAAAGWQMLPECAVL